jgi:C1A family cysteine protease
VDLDRQDTVAQEATTPLVSFEATDSATVANESDQVGETIALACDSDAGSQPGEATSGSVGLLLASGLLGTESSSQVEAQVQSSGTLGQSESADLTATASQDSTAVPETLPIEARGPPSADVCRQTTAVAHYGDSESSDPTKSPDTHTQAYAGVNVQPSTAPATPSFPALDQPVSYDLRTYGHVTPVKDQGAAGSCWAFGTYGALESSILVAGGAATDLSENHLKNYHGFDWGPTEGGNFYISEAYLSRWDGPASEADDPYHDIDDRPTPGGPPQYLCSGSAGI